MRLPLHWSLVLRSILSALVSSAQADPLSIALCGFSQQLMFNPELFWPALDDGAVRSPEWPNLKSLNITSS